MKKLLALAALATLAGLSAAPAFAADPVKAKTDVGVSISISQPGVYGRIDIGRFPQPTVVVQQPVIIAAPPRTVVVQPQPVVVARPEPVYMWVPPGHRKNWKKHCREYNACGVPVYFVRDDWYDKNVRGHGEGRGRDGDRDGRDDRGPGRGHGHGHGQGKRD